MTRRGKVFGSNRTIPLASPFVAVGERSGDKAKDSRSAETFPCLVYTADVFVHKIGRNAFDLRPNVLRAVLWQGRFLRFRQSARDWLWG